MVSTSKPVGTPVIDKERSGEGTPLKVIMVGLLPLDLTRIKGGVEAVIVNLFEGFKHMSDIRVLHLAFTKEIREHRSIQYSENIEIHYIPFKNSNEFADYVLNGSTLKRFIRDFDPDIIHIQEITPHLLRFLNFPKDRIVITQHGIMREEHKYAPRASKMKSLFKVFVERFVFPLFPHVIFISDYNRRLYHHRAPLTSSRIYNPVNPIFFESTSGSSGSAHTMLYVGVLSRRKNIRVVLEALKELSNKGKHFTLHVAGGFKDETYEKEIRAFVSDNELTQQVVFHGWVSQHDLQKLFDQAPLFILPSLQETLPVSIAEAMAMGKTVIASDVGAIGEMFTNEVSGFLFRKNDKEDLKRVLETIYEKNSTTVYGDSARREAAEKFHPRNIARQTISFYKQVTQYHAA